MATTKRMFSNDIVGSDAFFEMPSTSQALYFHLGMRCDDDGFVNPNTTMRMTGANKNDLDVLILKRFLLPFKNGVMVIKHHRINNNWDARDSRRTLYTEELKQLFVKENRSYTLEEDKGKPVLETYPKIHKLQLPDGNPTGTHRQNRIEKNRIEKNKDKEEINSSDKISIKKEILDSDSKEISLIFKEFEFLNPSIKRMYGNKTQRQACKDLIKTYTFERVIHVIKEILPQIKGQPFFPDIATPYELFNKWSKLESSIARYGKEKKIKNNVAF